MFLLGREILNYIFKAQDYSEDDWQFRNIKKNAMKFVIQVILKSP